MIQAISIIASLCNLASGTSYFKQLIKNESIPNPATWLIWVVVTMINAATYFFVVRESVWIALASGVMAAVIFIIFVTATINGKFTRFGIIDAVCLALAIAVGILWAVTNNPVLANVSLQVIFLISFYPTLHGLLRRQGKERPMPWFFASVSYMLQIVVVVLSPITLWALVFPIVHLVGNATIGLVALSQNRT